MVSQSSGEFIVSGLVNMTIPLCWDDPALPSMVRQPLVSVFDGLGSQTQLRGNEKPLTSFLLTVNFKLDDDMRYVWNIILWTPRMFCTSHSNTVPPPPEPPPDLTRV